MAQCLQQNHFNPDTTLAFLQVVALKDGGRIRSSAYLVSQAKFVTQDLLDAIDQEEEILPLGEVQNFQVSTACSSGAQKEPGSPTVARLECKCSHLGKLTELRPQSIQCRPCKVVA